MSSFWDKFWLPGTILVFGGFLLWQNAEFDTEVIRVENSIRRNKPGVLIEKSPNIQFAVKASEAQAKPVQFHKENMYPYGNPPYRNILEIAARKKFPKQKAKKLKTAFSADLEAELSSMSKEEISNLKLPESLKKDPEKRKKALKLYTDTYKVFEKQIRIATEVVSEAIRSGSRTEEEINEALEAIEQMKRGRRMVIDRIRVIEEAENSNADGQSEEAAQESAEQTLYGE